jgi:hypothetical protein
MLPLFPEGTTIPRLIHQTYRSGDLPEPLQRNVSHLKQQNPTFEYRFYSDSDIEQFIGAEYGVEILNRYRRIAPEYGAARADLFRYLLVYRLGGVYLDIKSTTIAPLESTLRPDDRYILSHWDNGENGRHEGWGRDAEFPGLPEGEFQQWHIIASAGHPFLRSVILRVLDNIDRYTPQSFGTGRLGTLRTTGPICYTEAITQALSASDGTSFRKVRTEAEVGLAYSVFDKPTARICRPSSLARTRCSGSCSRLPSFLKRLIGSRICHDS